MEDEGTKKVKKLIELIKLIIWWESQVFRDSILQRFGWGWTNQKKEEREFWVWAHDTTVVGYWQRLIYPPLERLYEKLSEFWLIHKSKEYLVVSVKR